jgi:hypothetical protein
MFPDTPHDLQQRLMAKLEALLNQKKANAKLGAMSF